MCRGLEASRYSWPFQAPCRSSWGTYARRSPLAGACGVSFRKHLAWQRGLAWVCRLEGPADLGNYPLSCLYTLRSSNCSRWITMISKSRFSIQLYKSSKTAGIFIWFFPNRFLGFSRSWFLMGVLLGNFPPSAFTNQISPLRRLTWAPRLPGIPPCGRWRCRHSKHSLGPRRISEAAWKKSVGFSDWDDCSCFCWFCFRLVWF